jgi:RNA polymerase sigma-70 factor (ECF subfamily)
MKSFTATDVLLSQPEASDLLNREAPAREFDRLLAANGPALGRLAASYTNTSSDRDDLFQEIAIALWQALPRFRGECSERTFLFRIAHNRGIAFLVRRRPLNSDVSDDLEIRDPAPNPETGLLQEQSAQRVAAAIRRLPVGYRQVITLMLEELGYGEIADVLGISVSNVGARLTRARQMLRELLEEQK